MRITLKFFSTLKDRLGCDVRMLELAGPEPARHIFLRLFDDRALGERLVGSTRFAVNCEYVSPETVVRDGDELAFIPPVSGG